MLHAAASRSRHMRRSADCGADCADCAASWPGGALTAPAARPQGLEQRGMPGARQCPRQCAAPPSSPCPASALPFLFLHLRRKRSRPSSRPLREVQIPAWLLGGTARRACAAPGQRILHSNRLKAWARPCAGCADGAATEPPIQALAARSRTRKRRRRRVGAGRRAPLPLAPPPLPLVPPALAPPLLPPPPLPPALPDDEAALAAFFVAFFLR